MLLRRDCKLFPECSYCIVMQEFFGVIRYISFILILYEYSQFLKGVNEEDAASSISKEKSSHQQHESFAIPKFLVISYNKLIIF